METGAPIETPTYTILGGAGITLAPQESRALASNRVMKGGLLSLVGAGAFFASAFLPFSVPTYITLVVGGMALFGWGALTAGRAASHLIRFGRKGSPYPLVAMGGLGVSLVSFAGTHLLLALGVEPLVRALNNLSLLGAIGFGALVLALMVRTLSRIMLESGEAP